MICVSVHTCTIQYIFPVHTGVSEKKFSWPCRTRIYKDQSVTRHHSTALSCPNLLYIHVKEHSTFHVRLQSAYSLAELWRSVPLFSRVLAAVIVREICVVHCNTNPDNSRRDKKYVYVHNHIRYLPRQATRVLPSPF